MLPILPTESTLSSHADSSLQRLIKHNDELENGPLQAITKGDSVGSIKTEPAKLNRQPGIIDSLMQNVTVAKVIYRFSLVFVIFIICAYATSKQVPLTIWLILFGLAIVTNIIISIANFLIAAIFPTKNGGQKILGGTIVFCGLLWFLSQLSETFDWGIKLPDLGTTILYASGLAIASFLVDKLSEFVTRPDKTASGSSKDQDSQ